MELIVRENKLFFKDEYLFLEDLHTSAFYKLSNKKSSDYKNDTFYVNELFLNFTLNYIALEKFIIDNEVTIIDARNASEKLFYYISDISEKHKLEIKGNKYFDKVFSTLKFHLQILSSSIFLVYLMLKIPGEKSKRRHGDISIIRTPASKQKIEKIKISSEYEDPFSKQSIYKFFARQKRVKWVLRSLFDSYKQFRKIESLMKKYHGKNSRHLLTSFYGKRIVHLNLYKYLLSSFFDNNDFTTFYTGNNLDRFAIVEEMIAKNRDIKLIGIPHGLEYGFKFPKCFTGDVFYSTSKHASKYFNKLYNCGKFIFDEEIIKLIFKKKVENKKPIKIVYFSEPRENKVNHEIIETMIPLLKRSNLELNLKLHPKESATEYSKYNINIIKEMNEAILCNICFARKSTILIEALYNNSSASAILLNNKDRVIFENFPSLQTKEIGKYFSAKELVKWIIIEYNKKKNEK